MSGASIEFDQVQGSMMYGTPGVARNDLWESTAIACRAINPGGPPNTSWAWTLLFVPPGSAAAVSGGTTAAASFTPDLPGSYLMQLITDGGGPGNVQVLVAAVRYNDVGGLVQRGWCLPALGEVAGQDNFGGNP